ncbi:cilia- and flagella-associated protein 74 isoform X2, partial [Silurus asotus]
EGIVPLVTCTHKGRILDFGYVLEKQSTSQVVTVRSKKIFTYSYCLLLSTACDQLYFSVAFKHILLLFLLFLPGTQNYSGQSVFVVSPTEGTIAPGETQDITVTFKPDHEGLHYRDALQVQLMNHQTVCDLELRGAASSHNMFICGGDPLNLCSESLIHPNI